MSNITQEKKVVDGNKEEYYRSLLQEVKRLARISSVRELDTYKQLSRTTIGGRSLINFLTKILGEFSNLLTRKYSKILRRLNFGLHY